MISYQTNDPKGWGGDPARGAALGRGTIDEPTEDTYKTPLLLKRVPIDKGGYDPNGTYFGTGEKLYWLASEDGKIDRVFRAKDDSAAIAYAGNLYPLAKIPERVERLTVEVCNIELDAFTQAYLKCALWSTTDDADDLGGKPLDVTYEVTDFAVETLMEAKRECEDFQETQSELLDKAYEHPYYDEESAGHDFWLTRNEHGAGFWDRGLGELGDALSKACEPYGGVDLYVGDDRKVYGSS